MKFICYKTHYGRRYLNCDYVQSFKEITESYEIAAVNEIGNETVIYKAKSEVALIAVMHSLTKWLENPEDTIFSFEK